MVQSPQLPAGFKKLLLNFWVLVFIVLPHLDELFRPAGEYRNTKNYRELLDFVPLCGCVIVESNVLYPVRRGMRIMSPRVVWIRLVSDR